MMPAVLLPTQHAPPRTLFTSLLFFPAALFLPAPLVPSHKAAPHHLLDAGNPHGGYGGVLAFELKGGIAAVEALLVGGKKRRGYLER